MNSRLPVVANFRPDEKGPDFDADIKIENTDMTAMNDLLRAYGKFDVVAGSFSFFSEMHVKNGYLTGYVKPLFKDVKAFDPEQDRDKSFVRRLYERVIGGASKLLKNHPRREVATKIDISGPLDAPKSWSVSRRFPFRWKPGCATSSWLLSSVPAWNPTTISQTRSSTR